jgi:hypothetical protein
MENDLLFCSKLMFTNGKIIVYKFMIQIYLYLYFCQSYSSNKDYLINYSQWIHLAGNCHRWSIIGRCWYNDHRSWKRYRFPSLVTYGASSSNNFNIRQSNSWCSVLLVEETRVPGENNRPVASHWQNLSHNVVSSTSRRQWNLNSQL